MWVYRTFSPLTVFHRAARAKKTISQQLRAFSEIIKSIFFTFIILKNAFSLVNLKYLLALPLHLNNYIKQISVEIRNLRRTIEQVILIARLPIELLRLLGNFFFSLHCFLKGISKPRRPRFI
jgi:hypothetical protein